MSEKTPLYPKISPQFGFQTQEMAVRVLPKKSKLYIGVPKEASFQEKRVALTPESVALLVNNGHRVVVETNAGKKSNFSDRSYSEVGAEIAYDLEKVFEADIIVKVGPLSLKEMEQVRPQQTIFSSIHLPTLKAEYVKKLMTKKLTAIAYEYIQDESGSFPMVRSISEIAGYSAIQIGAQYLSHFGKGQGILLGGISGVPPAKVIILGAGVVGEFATRAALGLGAEVRIFDNNVYKLMRLQNNLHTRLYTSTINPDTLQKELPEADLVIGAIHSESGRTPCVVSENMVASMKEGAVIVDVSIDQGGCFETSKVTNHKEPIFYKYGIVHYCVPNISSLVSKTASTALSHVLTPILLNVNRYRGIQNLIQASRGTRHGVYIYKGSLTNEYLGERFGLKSMKIDLLIASSF